MNVSIDEVRRLCKESKVKWSAHASERMMRRGITRRDVLACISGGEIIEQYPDYWLNPACLIFGYAIDGKVIHVVVGVDEYVHIVTAYYPDSKKFESDMKTRRKE